MNQWKRGSFLRPIWVGGTSLLAACRFVGILRAAGVGVHIQLLHKSEHVVFFKKNSSFDHYFGAFQPKNSRGIVNLLDATSYFDTRFDELQKNPQEFMIRHCRRERRFRDSKLSNFLKRFFQPAPYTLADNNAHWGQKRRFIRMSAQIYKGRATPTSCTS